MKRLFALLTVLGLAFSLNVLPGCGGEDSGDAGDAAGDAIDAAGDAAEDAADDAAEAAEDADGGSGY